MLAVGRALMGKPKLLLLDEPSMGLAPVLVDLIFDTIETIRDQGTTVLLVEQNALAALGIADYAYVLESGIPEARGHRPRGWPRTTRSPAPTSAADRWPARQRRAGQVARLIELGWRYVCGPSLVPRTRLRDRQAGRRPT